MRQKTVRIVICVAAAFVLTGASLSGDRLFAAKQAGAGLFSWQSGVFEDGGEGLFAFMKLHGFTELYQWFSSGTGEDAAADFLRGADNAGIDIYLLTGDPSWAKDREGKKLINEVKRAEAINGLTERDVSGIKGVVFDVEPQALPEWERSRNRDGLMKNFIDAMKASYSAAAFRGFEVILCIPNNFDDRGYGSELKTLIRAACDRVSVMNYAKGDEADRIENEARYSVRYGKGIINIYEFNPPGHYGIAERNTYNAEGYDAAVTNFAELSAVYPDAEMTMAAHDYEILKEILE